MTTALTAAMTDMTPVLVEVSCVVVANAHNPSILNHDWLIANDVLPDVEGGWEFAEPPFTTPPLSSIRYQNEVGIVLDSSRLAITVQALRSKIADNPERVVAGLATSYVSVLEHIPYVAVGSNFKAFIECGEAAEKLVETFGGTGPWKTGLEALSARLTHRVGEDCERHVDVAPGTAQKFDQNESKTVNVVLLSANYHRNTPDRDRAVKAISQTGADLRDFSDFARYFGEQINA